MNQNKICPECKTEYLPHIQTCADCGVGLLLHEELRKAEEEKRRIGMMNVENRSVVREGDLDWMSELRAVLLAEGIPCAINSDTSCKKGCSGPACRLFVSAADRDRALARIDEYYMEVNPEFRAASESIGEGKCPACGSPVGAAARECPDCGLSLLIVEEE